MKVEHIGIWVRDLEKMRHFYKSFFFCTVRSKISQLENRLYLLFYEF